MQSPLCVFFDEEVSAIASFDRLEVQGYNVTMLAIRRMAPKVRFLASGNNVNS